MDSLVKKKEKWGILVSLLLIKTLYVALIILFLPEEWKLFDYDRHINEINIAFEIPFLLLESAVFLSFYRRSNPITFLSTVIFAFILYRSIQHYL